MDADFSIELGSDDPVLDFPWKDKTGKFLYVDVKRHPEWIDHIAEAQRFHEIHSFLCLVNSSPTSVESAKCDAWSTKELSEEEKIYDVSCKFESYVDIVFSDSAENPFSPVQSGRRFSFSDHEQFARKLVELLHKAPDIPSTAEACVRRCFFENGGKVQKGFYFTLYVRGYGNGEHNARENWAVGLKLVGSAVVQLSATTNTRQII